MQTRIPAKKSTVGIIIGGLIGCFIGISVAFGLLVSEPIPMGYSPPKQVTKDTSYIVLGKTTGGSNWHALQKAFLGSNNVRLTINEASLNLWIKNLYREYRAVSSDNKIEILPLTPNFRLFEGKLQIMFPLQMSVAGKPKFKLMFVTIGNIVKKSEGYRFVPDKSYLGSAVIPSFASGGSFLYKKVLTAFSNLPDYAIYAGAWDALSHVEINNDLLKLERLQ